MASTLFEEDVVRRIHRGALQLGLVVRNFDGFNSLDDSEDEEEMLKKGYVRVAWYPRGREEVVGEGKVNLYDRSLMPGDAVRRNMGYSQRGIVRAVSVSCHLQVVRTKQMVYDVSSQDLEHIMKYTPSRHVVMGSWVGVVRNLYVQLIVCLKNGARCALSDDSACRLTDVHDYTDEDSAFSCDGFFPGQVLRGPATTFKNATWLSGQQPILSSKASFTVTVEEVKVTELEVHWQTRGLWKDPESDCTDQYDLQPPPRKVTEEMLLRVKPLSYFIAASTQIGDKVMYKIRAGDLDYPRPVTRGNISSFVQPLKTEGIPEVNLGKMGESDLKKMDSQSERVSGGGEPKSHQVPEDPKECCDKTEETSSVAMQASPKTEEALIGSMDSSSGAIKTTKEISTETNIGSETNGAGSCTNEAISSTQDTSNAVNKAPDDTAMASGGAGGAGSGAVVGSNSEAVDSPRKENIADLLGYVDEFLDSLGKLQAIKGQLSENMKELSGAACANITESAEQKALSCLLGLSQLSEYHERIANSDGIDGQDYQTEQKINEGLQELLARAEQPQGYLSQDASRLQDLKTLMENSSTESTKDIITQVRHLLKLTDAHLLASSSKEVGDAEVEKLGAAVGKSTSSKNLRRIRGMMLKSRNKRKCEEEKDGSRSSDGEEVWEEDSSEGSSEDSDAGSQTDSNASSKGEGSRRHKVVSSLLHRHTKKQHMRMAPKRRPPPRPLEVGERVCVEVTHTWTLADVMWQDGTLERGVVSADLVPVHQLDELEFFPGDFVTKNNESLENVYGLVCKTDHKERTCLIQWIMRPNQQCNVPTPVNTEEVSVYELTPHPDFTFNVGDIIVRIADSQRGIATMKKAKSDVKLNSPSALIGANGTHIGGLQVDQERIDCTQTGDSSTHVSNNISQMSQENSHIGDCARTGNAAVDTQMGTTQIATIAIAGHPGVLSDSCAPDAVNCKDTPRDAAAAVEHITDVEHLKENPSSETINISLPVDAATTTSLHSCLNDSLTPSTSTPNPQLHKTDSPVTLHPESRSPVTDKELGQVEIQKEATPDQDTPSVDQMNLANLKKDLATQAGSCPTLECKSSDFESTRGDQDEGVPCAGQVRWINTSGEIHVAWVDGSECAVLPQDLYKLEEDSDSDWSDNDHDDAHWKDEDQSQGSSDSSTSSWETASDASGAADEVNIASSPNDRQDLIMASNMGDAVPLEPQGDDSLSKITVDIEETRTALHRIRDQLASFTNSIPENLMEVPQDANHIHGGSSPGHIEHSRDGNHSVDTTETDNLEKFNLENGFQSEASQLEPEAEKEVASSPEQIPAPSAVVEEHTSQETVASSEKEDDPGVTEPKEECNLDSQDATPKTSEEGTVHAASAQACDNFFLMEEVTENHQFNSASIVFQPEDPKQFSLTMRREMRLLQTSLPQGIRVKGFADRMDLFSVLFEGPSNTPYENGLFYFDARLPKDYPKSPPVMHFHAYCSGRLNPNLYNDGKVCISLLGTWTGKGSEIWTSKSNLLQVLVSIQGLILVSEPYYNEAGYEKHRDSVPGTENSRLYNETAILKMVQSMTLMLTNPPEVFHEETVSFCRKYGHRMIRRVEHWLSLGDRSPGSQARGKEDQEDFTAPAFPLLPLSRGFVLSTRQALRGYRAALGVAGIPE
ncbi:(E3-independent) E2 ubiquitin-conjugating enzyme-like isoform X2 [Asterias rubens]|uniref:(E3-independent) E2 ubiquitin-conjugating enzyme-like isoform X2 n=1 Tax=Asterias rubens TaxID=7604 RepID=UPI00145558EB|nr:(E3-independent) E2 ubiquitin-conjugating enzyme-like isoform X2 [Asterias rubens]